VEDEPKPHDTDDAQNPPITPEDIDENGLILRIRGEPRFWLSGSDNPRVYDYRASRFLTTEEAAHRLRNLKLEQSNE